MPQRSAFRRRQKQDSTCNAEGGAEAEEEATKGSLQNSPTRDFETMKTNLALLSFSDDIDHQAYSPRQTRKKQTNKQYDAADISTRATSDNETKSTVDSEDTALAALISRISSVPVTLKRESNKGRGVYADAPITAGTVVMSECAIAAAVSTDKIAGYCSYCFRGNSSLRRCTGCQLLHYCNTTCQRADWCMHKYECKALKRLDSNSAIKAISTRIMARLLRQRHQDTSMVRLVDKLEGHKAQHTTTVMERYAQLSLAVRELIDTSELPSSAAELLELWCRLGCNSHAILDAELEDVGAGIYIGLSLLNHSCSPNCTILFDGTTAVTCSLCAINPGEELTINYLDVTLPKAKRQKELQDRYFFTCRYDKCQKLDVDRIEALQCSQQCGGILQHCTFPTSELEGSVDEQASDLPDKGICTQCHVKADKHYLTRALRSLESMQQCQSDMQNTGKEANTLEEIYTIHKRYLPIEHYLRRDIAQQRYTQALSTSQWSLAYDMARELLSAYQSLLLSKSVQWHPVVTVRLYAVAKLADICVQYQQGDSKPIVTLQGVVMLLQQVWDAARHTHYSSSLTTNRDSGSSNSSNLARWTYAIGEHLRSSELYLADAIRDKQ